MISHNSIIVPGTTDDRPRSFAELLNYPGQADRVFKELTLILKKSFIYDQINKGKDFVKRINTEIERKRRGKILFKWFQVLRFDFGFGMIKTFDELPRALRAEIDGNEYKPPQRSNLWAP